MMGGFWMMGFWLLFIAAIVIGIVWLARSGSFDTWRVAPQERPIEVLERRFAEGAMSSDEYRQRRADLLGERSPGSQV